MANWWSLTAMAMRGWCAFPRTGKYLGEFGMRGNGPGQFQLPHNVVIDAKGRIYVSDRDNQRVEVFDATGKYLRQWDHVGGVSSLIMTPDQQIWTGGVLHDLDGKVIERLPGEDLQRRAWRRGRSQWRCLSGPVERQSGEIRPPITGQCACWAVFSGSESVR